MRRFLSILTALLLVPSVTFAAIAFDSNADGGTVSASPKSWNQTLVASTPAVVVCVYANDATDLVTSVKGNGASFTKVRSAINGIYYNSMWYLPAATSSGNLAIVVTSTGSTLSGHSMAYTGAAATVDSQNSGSVGVSAGTVNATTTTVADNSWQVSCGTSGGSSPVASTGWTQRGASTGANIAGDSNGALTPAGLKTMTYTYTGAAGADFITLSLAPAGAVTASPFYASAPWWFLFQ